jgi:hypothetical protein
VLVAQFLAEHEDRGVLAAADVVMAEAAYLTCGGEFGGVPPIHEAVEMRTMETLRVEEDSVREYRLYYDQLAFRAHLGLVVED